MDNAAAAGQPIRKEAPPVDPGCLPAWDVDEMPDAPRKQGGRWWNYLGPGLVLAGGSIGTGEWVMGSQVAARYHGALMWVVVLAIVAQVILNTECMRYTLCTGEPILTGFMRTKPGPKFWLIFYLLLDVGGWFPTLASLAAQIMVVLVKGLTPADSVDPQLVLQYTYAIFTFCAVTVLFGGKIFNTLQVVVGGKFLFVLGYLLFANIFYVSIRTFGEIWGGLFDFTLNKMPLGPSGKPEIDWSLVSGLAGFAGIGGLGNIMASNFVREKGWGMGGKVGAIASMVGGRGITLSHLGTICRSDEKLPGRIKGWFQCFFVDQYIVWALGSLIAMMLCCTLGAEYLKPGQLNSNDQWRWAAALAQDFGESKGSIFRTMTLICGLVIMIPGQFYVVDGTARRWTDALWSGSRRIRNMDTGKVKQVYYFFAGLYVTWAITYLVLFPKLSGTNMMIIAGNIANLAIASCLLHTLYVNTRFIPVDARPPMSKRVMMFLSATFYIIIFSLVVNQKILPVLRQLTVPQQWAVGLGFIGVMVAIGFWSNHSVRRTREMGLEPEAI